MLTRAIEFDPLQAPAVFRRLGKRPAQHCTISPERERCCLLVAIYLDRFGFAGADPGSLAGTPLASRLGMGIDYASGLIYGWDGFGEGERPASVAVRDTGAWRRGNEAGQRSWTECIMAGLAGADPSPSSRIGRARKGGSKWGR